MNLDSLTLAFSCLHTGNRPIWESAEKVLFFKEQAADIQELTKALTWPSWYVVCSSEA